MENKQDKKVLFRLRNLKKYFPLKKKFNQPQRYVHANESITLDIYEGETLGLVGESGCGKSTLGRTMIQIYEQTEGSTLYYGTKRAELAPKYVKKSIKNISKLFPAYKKAVAELHEINEREKNATGNDLFAARDEAMHKRREIENKYQNMIRIAGGLLVNDDLDEVSSLLMNEYDLAVDVAKLRKEINLAEMQLKDDEYKKKWDSIRSKMRENIAQKDEEQKKLKEAHAKVEALRDSLRDKEDFDYYEDQLDEGIDLSQLREKEMRELRKDMQIIFQDPYSSLNTRMTLGNIIGEGVIAHKMFKSHKSEGYNEYIQNVMAQCGLAPYFIHRYPHQFSGGQRQRIGIARALALQPKFIVCDEAVSALDVSIQSQIINLLQDLKERNNLTYLFITHDLSVVKYISDRIAVMYLGMVVELTDSDELFASPLHPYTDALLAAIPRTDVDSDQELAILEGDIPSAVNPPKGCRFHTRCIYCMERCTQYEPMLREVKEGHFVACHLMDMDDEERKQFMDQRDKEHLEEQKRKTEVAQKMKRHLAEELSE